MFNSPILLLADHLWLRTIDKLCLLDVESDSLEMLRAAKVDCCAIFLKPPSIEVRPS